MRNGRGNGAGVRSPAWAFEPWAGAARKRQGEGCKDGEASSFHWKSLLPLPCQRAKDFDNWFEFSCLMTSMALDWADAYIQFGRRQPIRPRSAPGVWVR